MTEKPSQAQTFKTILAIKAYVENNGFSVSKSTLYEHQGAKFARDPKDGLFHQKKIDAYARNHLKLASTGQTKKNSDANLQEEKTQEEILRIRAIRMDKELDLKVKEESLIEVSRVEMVDAGKAVVLRAGIEGMIRSEAAKSIVICGGDPAKVGELIEFWQEAFADALDVFSQPKDFHAMLDD